MRNPMLVLAALLLPACSSTGASSKSCAPATSQRPGLTVFAECAVDRQARLAGSRPTLQYTPSPSLSCGRAIVELVVDSAGVPVPGTARLVRSNDASFGSAVLASSDLLRYIPAKKDGKTVAQVVRYDVVFQLRSVLVPAGSAPGVRPSSRRPPPPSC